MKMSNARNEHREQNPDADEDCLNTLLSMSVPWQEDSVMQQAKELGYDEACSKTRFKKQGKHRKNCERLKIR